MRRSSSRHPVAGVASGFRNSRRGCRAGRGACVAAPSEADVVALLKNAGLGRGRPCGLSRPVGRPVVHHNQLVSGSQLRGDGAQGFPDVRGALMRDDDYRERGLSHSTVPAMPSRRSMRASQPSSRRAFSTDGQRRCTSTSKLGRWRSSNSEGSWPQASQMIRAISAMVRSSDAEMLKSSFSAAACSERGDDAVGDVVHVRERARLLARAEDLERVLAGQHLADQVGHDVRDSRLGVGQLARPVGVEGAADRER